MSARRSRQSATLSRDPDGNEHLIHVTDHPSGMISVVDDEVARILTPCGAAALVMHMVLPWAPICRYGPAVARSAAVFERRIMMSKIEDAARAVCAGYALPEQYDAELAPQRLELSADETDRHEVRLGWLIERLGQDVRALAEALWGDTRLADDIFSCGRPRARRTRGNSHGNDTDHRRDPGVPCGRISLGDCRRGASAVFRDHDVNFEGAEGGEE